MLDRRSLQQELMDDNKSFDRNLAEQSFRFIGRINRLFGGTRVVREFIRAEAAVFGNGHAVRVLDIGAGSCDIPAAVCRWAMRKGIKLEYTCVERDGRAVECARRLLAGEPALPLTIVQEDIRDHRPDRMYDVATGSMFFHHLDDQAIVSLVAGLDRIIRHRLLINDLERSWPNYLGAALLCLPQSAGVKNDALLSVRRGFRVGELAGLLERIPGTAVSVRRRPFCRIAAVVDYGMETSNAG